MHGYGWWDASKSTEFPVEWTPDDILDSIKGVLQTTQYGPNSMITGIYQGISVKVIIRDSKIATAYPVHA
ncbi:EndoU domain-containing protein [Bifidobacterium simiarum]|nr:EndoU domain-containing protein [Bifidobacterium simiarum]